VMNDLQPVFRVFMISGFLVFLNLKLSRFCQKVLQSADDIRELMLII